jgi:hypothetical protein
VLRVVKEIGKIAVTKTFLVFTGRKCGLVVRVLAYRSRSPGSIPVATRFSEYWVWNGIH